MSEVEITKYSHGFSVKVNSLRAKSALLTYSLKVSQWGWVKEPPKWKPVRKIMRVFMGANKKRDLFWLSIYQLEDLMLHLGYKAIYKEKIKITEVLPVPGKDVVHERNEINPPREEQKPIIEYAVSEGPLKITNLQTGKGKTLVACETIARLGKRTVVQTKGGYIDRFVPGVEELFHLDKKKDLLVVKGGKALIGLINMAKAGVLEAKIIFISNKTMHSFLKEYDEYGDDNPYGCAPWELYALLDVGLKVIDEVHEDFHLNFKTNAYCNVSKILALSATLDTDDLFLKSIYDISLPPSLWFSGVKYDAYVDTVALMYKTREDDIETKERGSINYSHSAYEQWIMADKTRLKNYINMIIWILDEYHYADFKKQTKFIVFCRLTAFCDIVTTELRRVYHGERINTFIAETPESVLSDSDGIVTTVESCGTAKDIPNLRTAILTRNLNRREKNEQVKGRLRRLRDFPDIAPVFIYTNNIKVPKHLEYHVNKTQQFKGKVKSLIELEYGEYI